MGPDVNGTCWFPVQCSFNDNRALIWLACGQNFKSIRHYVWGTLVGNRQCFVFFCCQPEYDGIHLHIKRTWNWFGIRANVFDPQLLFKTLFKRSFRHFCERCRFRYTDMLIDYRIFITDLFSARHLLRHGRNRSPPLPLRRTLSTKRSRKEETREM